MFLLQRECKAVDNGSEDFEQLCNSVESLRLVSELEEHVIDGAANIRAQIQKFSVNAMQGSFQEITFPRVFGVKQLQ